MNELYSVSHDVGTSISTLVDHIEKMFKYTDEPGDDVPDKLQESYIKKYGEAREGASQSRKLLLEMRDIQSQHSFDEEFNSSLNEYIDMCEEFIRTEAELLSTLDDIVTVDEEDIEIQVVNKDTVEWDVNLRIAKDEFVDNTNQVLDSKDSFEQAVNSYIN